MTINKLRDVRATIFLIVSSFIAAHLCFWLVPRVFETWNAHVIDRLFLYRAAIEHLQPEYDSTIVHVDLNNTSIKQLNRFYLNRSHHAQAILNLASMNVSTLLYDFIFAAPLNESEDSALIDATRKAGNVYFGLAFTLLGKEEGNAKQYENRIANPYLEKTAWNVVTIGDLSRLYHGSEPLIHFLRLRLFREGWAI